MKAWDTSVTDTVGRSRSSSRSCSPPGRPSSSSPCATPTTSRYFTSAPTYVATYSYSPVAIEAVAARPHRATSRRRPRCPSTSPSPATRHGALPVRPRPDLLTPDRQGATQMTNLDRRQLLTAGALGAVAVPATAAGSVAAQAGPTAYASNYPDDPVTTGAQSAAAAAGRRSPARRSVSSRTRPASSPTCAPSSTRCTSPDAVDIVGVFGPEHGFRGTAQAGDSRGHPHRPAHRPHRLRRLRRRRGEDDDDVPTAGVETVVFDIQDVGARFYTYIWTMYTAMRAAVAVGARFVVLDRPNPVGRHGRGPMMTTPCDLRRRRQGDRPGARHDRRRAGPLLRRRVPHGDAGGRPASSPSSRSRGWRRDVPYAVTGLPWVMPSPQHADSRHRACLPRHRACSRAPTSPRAAARRDRSSSSAPRTSTTQWAERLAALDLPGVGFREAYFTPTFSKHIGAGLRRRPAPRHRPVDASTRSVARRDAGRGQGALPRLRLALRLLRPGAAVLDRQAAPAPPAADADRRPAPPPTRSSARGATSSPRSTRAAEQYLIYRGPAA